MGKKNLTPAQLQQKRSASLWRHIRKEWRLYTFLIVPIAFYLVFRYIPMLGNVIAFRKYKGGPNIFGTEWVGFKYFEQFIGEESFWRVFRNTLRLSLSYIAVRFPTTLIFALLINEIKTVRLRKAVQTISYLPHFISLVEIGRAHV